jgi:hypothetical protein
MTFPRGAGRGGAFLRWMVLGRWWRSVFAGEAGGGLKLKEMSLSMSLVYSGGAVSGRVDLRWVMGASSSLSLLVEWWHGLSVGGSGDRLKVEKMSLSTTSLNHLGGVVSCVIDLYQVVLVSSLLSLLVKWWHGVSAGGVGNGLELKKKEMSLSVSVVCSDGVVLGRVDLHWVVMASSSLSSLVEWGHSLTVIGAGEALKLWEIRRVQRHGVQKEGSIWMCVGMEH